MVMAAVGAGIYADRDSTISGFSPYLYFILPFLTRVVLGLYILYIYSAIYHGREEKG